MKKLLGIVVLGLGFMMFIQNQVSADYMSDEKCAELSGKAHTDYAARKIYFECGYQEDVLLSIMYNHDLKCAIKAGKARTEQAARRIWFECS